MTWIPTERINCFCGGSFTMSNKSKHYKTKWHSTLSNFILNNQQLNSNELQQKCEELKTPRYHHKVINVIGAEQCIAA